MNIITQILCFLLTAPAIFSKLTVSVRALGDGPVIEVSGIAYDSNGPVNWDEQYKDIDGEKFQNLQEELCLSLRRALSENNTFANAWRNCKLLIAQKGSVVVKNTIFLDGERLKEYFVDVNSNTFVDGIKGLLVKYAPDPLNVDRYIGKVKNVELLKDPTILINGVLYMDGKELPWQKEFGDNSSAVFKNLAFDLCQTLFGVLSQNVTFLNAWKKCELVEAKKGSVVATNKVTLDWSRIQESEVDVKSEAFLKGVKDILQAFAAKPHYGINYMGKVNYVTAGAVRNSWMYLTVLSLLLITWGNF